MHPKYIALLVFIYTIGTLLSLLYEETYLSANEIGVLDGLLVWREMEIEQPWDVFKTVGPSADFFVSIFDMLTFNYSFLSGNEYVLLLRIILMAPIMALIVYGLIMTLIGLFSRAIDFIT